MPPRKVRKTTAGDITSSSPAKASKPSTKASSRPATTKQNPLSIGEIRNTIYKDLLHAVPSDGRLRVTYLSLDNTASKVQLQEHAGKAHDILDVVPQSGFAKVLRMPLAQVPKVFKEFLSENSNEMMFAFLTPVSLSNFSELINACVAAPPDVQTPIHVLVHVFHEERFEALRAWKEIDMAHGYREDAHRHFKEWMDVVQTLPIDFKVTILLHNPWTDYRSLRGVTAPLRAQNPAGVRLRRFGVAVAVEAWDDVPQKDFHLGMTIACMKGLQFSPALAVSDNEAGDLVKYGCRGFRSATG